MQAGTRCVSQGRTAFPGVPRAARHSPAATTPPGAPRPRRPRCVRSSEPPPHGGGAGPSPCGPPDPEPPRAAGLACVTGAAHTWARPPGRECGGGFSLPATCSHLPGSLRLGLQGVAMSTVPGLPLWLVPCGSEPRTLGPPDGTPPGSALSSSEPRASRDTSVPAGICGFSTRPPARPAPRRARNGRQGLSQPRQPLRRSPWVCPGLDAHLSAASPGVGGGGHRPPWVRSVLL